MRNQKSKKGKIIIEEPTSGSKKAIECLKRNLFFIVLTILFLVFIYILFKLHEMDKEKTSGLKYILFLMIHFIKTSSSDNC